MELLQQPPALPGTTGDILRPGGKKMQLRDSQRMLPLDENVSLADVLQRARNALRPRQSAVPPTATWESNQLHCVIAPQPDSTRPAQVCSTFTNEAIAPPSCPTKVPFAKPSMPDSHFGRSDTASHMTQNTFTNALQHATIKTDLANQQQAGTSQAFNNTCQEALFDQPASLASAPLPSKTTHMKLIDKDKSDSTAAIAETVLSRARNALKRVHGPPLCPSMSNPVCPSKASQTLTTTSFQTCVKDSQWGLGEGSSELDGATKAVPCSPTCTNSRQNLGATKCTSSAAPEGWSQDRAPSLPEQHGQNHGVEQGPIRNQDCVGKPVPELQDVSASQPPHPTPLQAPGLTQSSVPEDNRATSTPPLPCQAQNAGAAAAMDPHKALLASDTNSQLPAQSIGKAPHHCIVTSAPPAVQKATSDQDVKVNTEVTVSGLPQTWGVTPKGPASPMGTCPSLPWKSLPEHGCTAFMPLLLPQAHLLPHAQFAGAFTPIGLPSATPPSNPVNPPHLQVAGKAEHQCAAPSTPPPVQKVRDDQDLTPNAEATAPVHKRPPVKPKGPPLPVGKAPKSPPKAPAKASPKAKVSAKPVVQDDSQAPFLRKLYWKQLDLHEAEGTLFSCSTETDKQIDSCFDAGALTRMFEGEIAKFQESKRKSSGVLNKAKKRHTGLTLLCDHRARNIAIVLRLLYMPTQELTKILSDLRWEAVGLSSDDLEQIIEVIPTQEEAKQLLNHSSPEASEQLRDIEQMVLPLAMLNRANTRVRLLCIARNAHSNFKSTSRSLAMVRSACNSIQGSSKLREVMRLALEIGNYINHGNSSKGAKAISIGSLMALKDFKTGRMSSLHFLCASLLQSQPNCDAAEVVEEELRPATSLASLQVQSMVSSVRSFQRDLDVINAECRSYLMEYAEEPNSNSEDASPKAEDHESSDEDLSAKEEKATRFVEDVVKLRGSARKRLRCMRLVVERLNKQIRDDMHSAAQQVNKTLRFCGVVPAPTKDIPQELEPLLLQLAEFVQVFRHHWDAVHRDFPKYRELFGGASASTPAAEDTVS